MEASGEISTLILKTFESFVELIYFQSSRNKFSQKNACIVLVHYAYPTRFVNALRMLPPCGTFSK